MYKSFIHYVKTIINKLINDLNKPTYTLGKRRAAWVPIVGTLLLIALVVLVIVGILWAFLFIPPWILVWAVNLISAVVGHPLDIPDDNYALFLAIDVVVMVLQAIFKRGNIVEVKYK